MYYGVMMVKAGDADGMVSGAIHSTGDMLRPALQIIKTKPGIKTRVLLLPDGMPEPRRGRRRRDDLRRLRRRSPTPTPRSWPTSPSAAADSARALAGIEPRVAMLSFSTKGSAKHDSVTKVQEATQHGPRDRARPAARRRAAGWTPRWCESVGQLKAPGSTVAGHANVLVFPRPAGRQHRLQAGAASGGRGGLSAPSCRAWPSP